MKRPADWIIPDWPAPAQVRCCVTTRSGGVSQAPFDSFNLGDHVDDDPVAVAENRRRLQALTGAQPAWLNQVHSTRTVKADLQQVVDADASWTDEAGIACTVMTADCLPVLFCDRKGSRVAAAHAGWRGLAGGILETTLQSLQVPVEELLVWLGPAIGPECFEVGAEVRDAFMSTHAEAEHAFVSGKAEGKYLADIYQLARIRLAAAGVTAVHGGGWCTLCDPRFYSYRRASRTGRFASLIWLQH